MTGLNFASGKFIGYSSISCLSIIITWPFQEAFHSKKTTTCKTKLYFKIISRKRDASKFEIYFTKRRTCCFWSDFDRSIWHFDCNDPPVSNKAQSAPSQTDIWAMFIRLLLFIWPCLVQSTENIRKSAFLFLSSVSHLTVLCFKPFFRCFNFIILIWVASYIQIFNTIWIYGRCVLQHCNEHLLCFRH